MKNFIVDNPRCHQHKRHFSWFLPYVLLMFFILNLPLLGRAQVDEVGPRSLKLNLNGNRLRIPYFSDFQLDSANSGVKKIVVVIHGMNRNAGDYFRNMKEAASMSSHYTDSVMIVAPQFLEEEDLDPNGLDNSYLYWSSGWKSGSNSKNNAGHPRPARISSYAVMDTLMFRLAEFHPNLKYIILAGHSAGGQLVNRYSAASPLADLLLKKYGIKTRFIVANPSSYLYLDEKRVVKGTTDRFEAPNTTCSKYNNWRYGLDNLYSYPDQFGADSIRHMLKRHEVVYLLGELDTDENSSSLDQSCQAELQGSYRLERGTIYYNYLKFYYGDAITQTQHRDTVPGVGHDNRGMFTSSVGRYWLFMSDPGESPAAVTSFASGHLNLYPNPAGDMLNVEVTGNFKPAFYSLMDEQGRVLIAHKPVKNKSFFIRLNPFRPGVYLLLLENQKITITKKFVKY